MKEIVTSIKVFILFSVLLGLLYPLAITGIAQATMKDKANGSLIIENGQIVGSSLIGQKFDSPTYFNSRPSAVDYNAAGSGASNLGPSSKKLVDRVKADIAKDNLSNNIPADMVLTSASGLDPHISIENAKLQAQRIAKVRGLQISKLDELISNNTDSDFLGIWGGVNDLGVNDSAKESSLHGSVNVLKLNLDLDKANRKALAKRVSLSTSVDKVK